MITITLEGTPTAKARAKVGKWGAYTPKKSEAYSNALAWEAAKVMKGKAMLEGALVANITCYMPIPKSQKKWKVGDPHIIKPDLDNIVKQLDALNAIVYKDDSQIAALSACKVYSDEPRITITIERLV